MSSLAERITEACTLRGISARELSRRAGMNPGQVGAMQSRIRNDPQAESGVSARTISTLAEVLGVRLEWLMHGRDPMVPDPTDAAYDPGPHDVGDDAPSPDTSSDLHPTILGHLPYYPELVRAAKKARPDTPQWVYNTAYHSHPLIVGTLSIAGFIATLDLIYQYSTPVDPSRRGGAK